MEKSSGNKPTSPDSDSTKFLDGYFRKRGIEPLEESAVLTACVKRAEEARVEFKRQRLVELPSFPRRRAVRPTTRSPPHTETNTADEAEAADETEDGVRYTRRLHNN